MKNEVQELHLEIAGLQKNLDSIKVATVSVNDTCHTFYILCRVQQQQVRDLETQEAELKVQFEADIAARMSHEQVNRRWSSHSAVFSHCDCHKERAATAELKAKESAREQLDVQSRHHQQEIDSLQDQHAKVCDHLAFAQLELFSFFFL